MEQKKMDFYSNNVNIVSSIYDITLQFTSQSPIGAPDKNKTTPVEITGICNVRMSPQHAKALAALLVEHIKGYESQTKSELALPQNLQQIWNELVEGK